MAKKTSVKTRTGRERAGTDAQREEYLIQVLRKKAQQYLRSPNVTSVGVGKRVVNGKPTGEYAIQFTVGRKLGPEALVAEGIPPLPSTIKGDDGEDIPVDVIQRSYKASYEIIDQRELLAQPQAGASSAASKRRSRLDTIVPGISVSHVDGTAGTFGAVVFDSSGTPCILSNWHVLHGPTGELGDEIVQPGPHDNGNVNANVMGRLLRSHLGMAGDCAVCSIFGRQVDGEILELDVVPKRIARVGHGDAVVKSGRTTGVTFGIVTRVGVVVNIDYGPPTGVQTIGGFEIGVNPAKPPTEGEVSMGGDSGSLWLVDTDGADRDVAVGLHFAGETDPHPSAEHAVACAIHSVFEKLQVSFVASVPQGTGPSPASKGNGRRRRAAPRKKRRG
jgi:endonuclease G